jgi:outer membrane protein OmpA-like peptidoglycan-associated protein/thiol-disulfide isomerase/thioredoxin
MRSRIYKLLFLLLVVWNATAQNCSLKNGDKASPLVLNDNLGSLQSLTFPYLNKLVLVHFWASSVAKSKPFIPRAIDLQSRYSSIAYRNAEGFEVISVALQSDKNAWKEDLAAMGMDKIVNLIAVKGYKDISVCNFKIVQLPVTLLIDEMGTIVLVNPTQLQIEDVLDGKKNSPPNTRDLKGMLLGSESPKDIVKNEKMVLMNKFNDTLSRTTTDASGHFQFTGVKYLAEYVLRTDTSGLSGKSKAFLSTGGGAVFAGIPKMNGKFEYTLSLSDIATLSGVNKETGSAKNAISFNANITFKKGSAELESTSGPELDKVAVMMTKNKEYTMEIVTHTDSRGDDADNLELSKKRSSSVKAYLVAKGIAPARMKPVGKGESELKNNCKNKVNCTDDEHAENVRTELKFFKP